MSASGSCVCVAWLRSLGFSAAATADVSLANRTVNVYCFNGASASVYLCAHIIIMRVVLVPNDFRFSFHIFRFAVVHTKYGWPLFLCVGCRCFLFCLIIPSLLLFFHSFDFHLVFSHLTRHTAMIQSAHYVEHHFLFASMNVLGSERMSERV